MTQVLSPCALVCLATHGFQPRKSNPHSYARSVAGASGTVPEDAVPRHVLEGRSGALGARGAARKEFSDLFAERGRLCEVLCNGPQLLRTLGLKAQSELLS